MMKLNNINLKISYMNISVLAKRVATFGVSYSVLSDITFDSDHVDYEDKNVAHVKKQFDETIKLMKFGVINTNNHIMRLMNERNKIRITIDNILYSWKEVRLLQFLIL